jgi:hypothetical protein
MTPPNPANITRTAAVIVAASCCWPLNAHDRFFVVRPPREARISITIGMANRAHATHPISGSSLLRRMTLP